MKLKVSIAVAALGFGLICGSAAQAGTVLLSDNFNGENGGLSALNYAGFANWDSTGSGGVDLVQNGFAGITCAGGTGACVDLAGTPGPGQITTKQMYAITKGQLVTLSFQISGDQRNSSNTYTDFTAGLLFPGSEKPIAFTEGGAWGGLVSNPGLISSIAQSTAVYANMPWTTYSFSFIAGNSGYVQPYFGDQLGGNIGPVLDNVNLSVAAVPEPATWAMLLLGLGVLGAVLRTARREEARASAGA